MQNPPWKHPQSTSFRNTFMAGYHVCLPRLSRHSGNTITYVPVSQSPHNTLRSVSENTYSPVSDRDLYPPVPHCALIVSCIHFGHKMGTAHFLPGITGPQGAVLGLCYREYLVQRDRVVYGSCIDRVLKSPVFVRRDREICPCTCFVVSDIFRHFQIQFGAHCLDSRQEEEHLQDQNDAIPTQLKVVFKITKGFSIWKTWNDGKWSMYENATFCNFLGGCSTSVFLVRCFSDGMGDI